MSLFLGELPMKAVLVQTLTMFGNFTQMEICTTPMGISKWPHLKLLFSTAKLIKRNQMPEDILRHQLKVYVTVLELCAEKHP